MAKKKKSKESSATSSYSVELIGLILILIGIIGFGFGFVGSLIKKFAMFLAGAWWIVVLIFTIILGIYMLYKRKMPKFTSGKLIGLYLIFIIILVASHFEFLNLADNPGDIFKATYDNFMERISSITANNALETSGTTSVVIGGGFIGATFITLLYSLFGKTGSIVILVIIGIFAAVLTFNVNLSNIFSKIFGIFKHKKKEKKEVSSDEVITTNSNEEVKEEPKQDKIVITSMDELKQKPIEQESLEPKRKQEDIYEDGAYTLPKFNEIFDPIKQKKVNSTEFTKSNKEILERVLRDFGVNAKVVEIHIGPAVTEYELTVPAGTKVSRIVNINKEIALALAAKDVIIQAPIPGKSTIGVEIPNPTISSVTLREVLESPQNLKSDAKICAALGKDIMGTPKVMDLTKMPHLLVAGSTGSGKSVCINGIIASILMRYKPNEVKLVLVDPKKVELTNYNGIPHLLCPVVSDPKKASLTLQQVVSEMDKRFTLFSECEVKNISGYNELIEKENKKHPEKMQAKMPYIVVIIDELADLMLVASKEVEDSITRITQLARAAGIHLIVATQRPSTDVITGLIKNNIPSRISFAVSSQIDSRTILDQPGAEKLLGKGDMLYFPMGDSAPTRIQGCFINDDEIKRLIDYCKSQATVKYNEEFENVSTNTSSGSTNSYAGEDDAAYNEVVEFAIQTGKISASLIQRRFRFGYNRAARLMDLLESRGIVGPQNGSKPREVLVKLEKNDEEE
ncbi:MAG TPA: cell division protein FtsK [Candidatus Onthocola stercorigallinarum]|nr:cell division protein FtsK [Candidatus Onthocola stercorigallinarum]